MDITKTGVLVVLWEGGHRLVSADDAQHDVIARGRWWVSAYLGVSNAVRESGIDMMQGLCHCTLCSLLVVKVQGGSVNECETECAPRAPIRLGVGLDLDGS